MNQFQSGLKNILQKHPNDVVFLSALRTPITRGYKGGLRNAYPEQMLAAVRFHHSWVFGLGLTFPDVAVGTVLSELGGSKAGRMALNHVGYPTSTALYTVNRACASSLQAITSIADSIAIGRIDMGIGAGMESMTKNYGSKAVPTQLWPELKKSEVKEARDCIMPMGITSENVADRYGVSRVDQDAFGAASHQRASKAQREGLFDKEIVPISVTNPPGEGNGSPTPQPAETVEVSKDDGIRHNASAESMSKLKPVFKETGATTAGNSSQISDGAAAALMCRRSTATELGLTSSIIGKFAGSTVVGCAPDEMGVGPAYAIPALLDSMEISKDDIGVWEINEAFASQALYCVRKLGLEKQFEEGKINPRGGAIALGHPLGATGGRMVSTMLSEMEGQMFGELGVVSMCIGTGMGMAGLIVRE
ncbi:acetyl-CoA acyltransferase 1, partial [Lecanoromycetidae sp. Uapishka_2]